jgi:hypothetical protein
MSIHRQSTSIQAKRFGYFALLVLLMSPLPRVAGAAQTAPATPAEQLDVIIFSNGDKLTGQFERSNGGSVVFKAEMAGEITVDWAKVKEIRTNRIFAVIPKGVEVKRGEDPDKIPQGALEVSDQKIRVSAREQVPQTFAAGDTSYVIDQKTFDRAVLKGEGVFEAWTGAITLGTSLVEATQKSNTLSGAASLIRTTPQETWLDRRDRSTLNFSFAYGMLTQPGTPHVKTDIYHLDLEHDRYFTSRLFAFGQGAYDHNFSQGLDLQQSYGAGIGWTVVKNATDELDLRVSADYVKQQFAIGSENQNLIGSPFAEAYTRKFVRNIVLSEQASATPAWNNLNAYSANGQIGLAIPIYKRFSLGLTALDTFLNNPLQGFRKNSFQFTTGLTYSIK